MFVLFLRLAPVSRDRPVAIIRNKQCLMHGFRECDRFGQHQEYGVSEFAPKLVAHSPRQTYVRKLFSLQVF